MIKNYSAPSWSKRAQKKLIDKEMSKRELAERIHVNYTQLVNVLSGYLEDKNVKQRVLDYLKIKE